MIYFCIEKIKTRINYKNKKHGTNYQFTTS